MYCLVYATCGSLEEAEYITKHLIQEKLAACVNFFPIRSSYLWNDEIQKDNEYVLFIKSRTNLSNKIIERIKSLHSYEVPAIMVYEISDGNSDFFNWIDEQIVEY